MNTVIVENCKTLFIGRRGENEVTEVVFDFSEWQAEFGNGVIDLYVKRNLDVDAYPVVLSVDGTVATWLVTAADTDVVGNGKIEFVYTVNEKVAKSAVFPFFVGEDIGQASSEPPDPYESWIETLTELGTETQANAQAAAQSASDAAGSAASASESAGQAEDSAEDAEAWAVGERNGEPVSVGDETYENSAKYWAWKAKTDAPVTSVNGEAGDIVLDLDDIPNGETYARATPEQLAQIGENADDIADIDAMIPNTTSESNHLVNVSFLTNRLTSYRTSAAQDTIDAGKQDKITAYGILKRDRSGNITAAIAGADYVTADALNSYRKATAQDAIDNAQNQNINKNTAALSTMQPAATAADIGKALIVKTVADGKPTSYEYGEAGGGGSSLTAGDGIDIANDVISNTQGIEYIVGTQTAATSKWTGNSTDEELKVGKIIAYYLPYAGATTAATLALTMADGTTTREISLQYKPNATVTTQFPAGSIIILVYDGSYWRVNASYDTDTNTYPTGYCVTNGSVAAKAAVCSFGYRGDTNYFPCLFRYANTAADATLAITTYAPEAAPIYVNGARTSATNTFGPGVILFLYYNGAYYCYNDGRFPILVDGAVTSVQEYATGLLVNYRTAAAQDTIDSGKQAKITATGILKGDGAGGVSSAAAGTDYATPQQVNEKYAKPSGGIPSTDMTAAVQASLSKAESALQAVPDTYRTAADQDVIDNGKQAKITASGILKGDGAGGVSAAVAGVDYLKSAPVTSVNGQTGDVTIQTATDAQVTTAVNTWLGENVVQETGYVLDASLTMSNAAPPASAVGDLKSAVDNNAKLSFLGGKISCGWEQGSYRFSDGSPGVNLTRIRTKSYIDKSIKYITADSAHAEFGVLAYDDEGVFQGTWNGTSLGTATAWLASVNINDIDTLGSYNFKISLRDKVNTSAEIGIEYADYLTCSTNIGHEVLLASSKSFSGQALVHSTSTLSDFNNAIINRYYSINTANIPNQPTAEKGHLVYFGLEGGSTTPKSGREFQVFISESGEIYYRWNMFLSGAPWSKWEKTSSFPSFSMFQSFGIIGDSFASGEIYDSTTGNHADYFELSWGQILARLSGNTCVNYSTGGLSSKTWLTNSNGLAKLNAENANNLYIITLGINDANTLGTAKLGTIADIESDNTDNFYSYYGRIVRAIRSHAPTAVIMLSTLARTGTTYNIYSEAIREIGQYYTFPVLDLSLSNFFASKFFTSNQISNHPTAITYSAMAKEYKNLIEKALEENATLYRGYTG